MFAEESGGLISVAGLQDFSEKTSQYVLCRATPVLIIMKNLGEVKCLMVVAGLHL